jgi:hypothetical protein
MPHTGSLRMDASPSARITESREFVVVGGFFQPSPRTPCRGCGATDMLHCHPGSFPKCGRCGAILLYLGRVPSAPCVTPNGRVDGHMSYVEGKPGAPSRCSFCKRTQ